MATRLQVYQALEPLVGNDVAEELAGLADQRRQLVTESVFRTEVHALRTDIRVQIADLKADTRGWMLKFFVPLWIGVYGTLAAVAISIVVRH